MSGGHDVVDKCGHIVVDKGFPGLILVAEDLVPGEIYLFGIRQLLMSREKLGLLHLLGQVSKALSLRCQAHGVYLQLRQLVRALQRPAEVLTGGIPGLAAELLQRQLPAAVHMYLVEIVLHILGLKGKGEHAHLFCQIVGVRGNQSGVFLAGNIQVGGGLHVRILPGRLKADRQQGRVQQHRQGHYGKVHMAHADAPDLGFFLLGIHTTINS